MFSTSIIASSTTSPSAITSPASTIVLMVAPEYEITNNAATSDRGIAVRLMTAVRQSYRNTTRMTATSMQPTRSAFLRLSMARSMNVAGRKMVGSMRTSFSRGRSLDGGLDAAGQFQGVRLRLLLDDEQDAGAVVDHGVADRRRRPDLDPGDVPQPDRRSAAGL